MLRCARITGFITTLSASLKPRGRIVLSLNNPYSALLREKVENYFDSEAVAQYVFGPASTSIAPWRSTSQAFQTADLVSAAYDVHMTEAMVARLPAQNRHFPWYPFYHRFPGPAHSRTHQHRALRNSVAVEPRARLFTGCEFCRVV